MSAIPKREHSPRRRLSSFGERVLGSHRGGFKTPPGPLDQLLAAVPVVLVVASFVI